MKTVFYLLMLLFLISCKSTSVNIKEIGVIDRQQKSGIKFYENGEYEKAFHELSELAAWGYKDSQYALAFMFLKGLYVEQSILIGMGWLGVAAESNIEEWTALFDKLYSSATDEDKSKFDVIIKNYKSKFGLKAQHVNCKKASNGYSRRIVMRCIKDLGKRTTDYKIDLTESALSLKSK